MEFHDSQILKEKFLADFFPQPESLIKPQLKENLKKNSSFFSNPFRKHFLSDGRWGLIR